MSKATLSSFKEDKNNLSIPAKWEWILMIGLFLFLFYSHNYWDLIITTRHGINVWDALFSGNIRNYYVDNLAPEITNFWTFPAVYSFPVYLLFAIWNFPLWLMERVLHVDPFASRLALSYAKSILLPFLFGSAWYINKIAKELDIRYAKWTVFHFLSGTLIFSTLGIQGQYDIISVFFTLMGIYYYMKGSMPKFILWFSVAIIFKLFALFIFIPFLLLKEKRILHILKDLVLVNGLFLITLLLSPAMTPEAKSVNIGNSGSIFRNTLPIFSHPVPIFVIAIMLLYIYCYYKKPEENLHWWAIYASFTAMAILFALSYNHPYWNVIMAPYLSLLVFKIHRDFKFTLILETVLGASLTLALMLSFPIPFSLWNINNGFLATIFGWIMHSVIPIGTGTFPIEMANHISIDWAIERFIHNETMRSFFLPMFAGIMVAVAVALVVFLFQRMNHPDHTKTLNDQPIEENIRQIMWVRTSLGFLICTLPLLTYIIAAKLN